MTVTIKDFNSEFKGNLIRSPLYKDANDGYIKRKTTTLGMERSQDIALAIETLATDYMKYRGTKALPARIDFGFTKEKKLVPFEINTGFVDQIGAGLNLAEATDQEYFNSAINTLGDVRKWNKIILTQPEYANEMLLMKEYIQKAGIETTVIDNQPKDIDEEVFCYGYPTIEMLNNKMFTPGGIGLNLESKKKFYEFLDQRGKYNDTFSMPNRYNKDKTPYIELPKGRDLVFKKDGPKVKGDKLTILIAKAKNKEDRIQLYESGEIIIQELIDPFITSTGGGIEVRALLMPDITQKYSLIIAYTLLGDLPEKRRLVNDSNPQGPIVIK